MSISNKLKWKRSLSKLRYVHEELELVEQLSKAAAGPFQQHYEVFCDERDINISDLNKKHRDNINKAYKKQEPQHVDKQIDSGNIKHTGSYGIEVYNDKQEVTENDEELKYVQDSDTSDMHIAFSKLFKKIAVILHPDKIDRTLPQNEIDERIENFTAANGALVKKKYFVLLDVAERYNVTTPKNYSQQVRWMKKEIDKIETTINNKKMTYNYMFSEAESKEEQDEVIRKFMFQLFGINVKWITSLYVVVNVL